MWSNWVRQNRETDDRYDEDCVEEGCQLAKVKFAGMVRETGKL